LRGLFGEVDGNGPADTLKEGYVTSSGDRWICPECLNELRETMTWTLVTS